MIWWLAGFQVRDLCPWATCCIVALNPVSYVYFLINSCVTSIMAASEPDMTKGSINITKTNICHRKVWKRSLCRGSLTDTRDGFLRNVPDGKRIMELKITGKYIFSFKKRAIFDRFEEGNCKGRLEFFLFVFFFFWGGGVGAVRWQLPEHPCYCSNSGETLVWNFTLHVLLHHCVHTPIVHSWASKHWRQC